MDLSAIDRPAEQRATARADDGAERTAAAEDRTESADGRADDRAGGPVRTSPSP